MDPKQARRSERVSVELPIQVSGSDATGREFYEEARTTVVSRDGAKIRVARKLAPQQELIIRCLETGREAIGRVVGQIETGPEGYTYGISLIDAAASPWGIEFPPSTGEAAGRVVLECLACHSREVAYLDEFELEVLEATQALSRHCKRCTDASVWKKSFGEVPPEPPPAPRPAVPVEQHEKRREPRRALRVSACIRSKEFGEDLVMTQNVSRHGVCFESSQHYVQGWMIEVAVPYSKGGGNIFVPGRIAYARETPPSELVVCGVQYTERKD
jgi:hypothetical protein